MAGAPLEIKGSFWCNGNKLTNLLGGPVICKENYICSEKILIDLEGAPKEVVGVFLALIILAFYYIFLKK